MEHWRYLWSTEIGIEQYWTILNNIEHIWLYLIEEWENKEIVEIVEIERKWMNEIMK